MPNDSKGAGACAKTIRQPSAERGGSLLIINVKPPEWAWSLYLVKHTAKKKVASMGVSGDLAAATRGRKKLFVTGLCPA